MTSRIRVLDVEPFVDLPSTNDFTAAREVDLRTHVHQLRQSEKYRLYLHAFDYLHEFKIFGDYLEFGIHRARTFRMALSESCR